MRGGTTAPLAPPLLAIAPACFYVGSLAVVLGEGRKGVITQGGSYTMPCHAYLLIAAIKHKKTIIIIIMVKQKLNTKTAQKTNNIQTKGQLSTLSLTRHRELIKVGLMTHLEIPIELPLVVLVLKPPHLIDLQRQDTLTPQAATQTNR